jgi:tetratricopeptide (TPR) repeat protein
MTSPSPEPSGVSRHPAPSAAIRRLKAALSASVLLFVALIGFDVWWFLRQQAEADGLRREVERLRAEGDRKAAQAAAAVEADLNAAYAAVRSGDDARAREALERAEGRLSGEAPLELRESFQRLRDDLNLVAALEEIRLEAGQKTPEGRVDWKAADADYNAAFRVRGLDMLNSDPEELATRLRLSAAPGRLSAALDGWAFVKMAAGDREWERLLDDARNADDSNDPLRRELRTPEVLRDAAKLKELAARPETADWPAEDVVLLAGALRAATEPEAAVEVLRDAQRRNPGDLWLNHLLGVVLLDSRPPRPDEAVGFLRAAAASRPRSPFVHLNLGDALSFAGKEEEAEAEYREALRPRPEDLAARVRLGGVLRRKGKPEEAEREFREALRIDPDCFEAHVGLGGALVDRGKPQEAEAEYREALRLRPFNAFAHRRLGDALRAQGRRQESAEEYQKASTLTPASP